MRVAISFDYDSPAGYRESFSKANLTSNADVEGTKALLDVLARHKVKTTFAIVGNAALEGDEPEHCPAQVRAIQDAGHEIASHSMHHRFIPPMRNEELLADLKASKQALERCSGQIVRGFVPPFNRPSHFPQKGAFSFSEMIGSHGRGRGRQTVGTLLASLETAGFGWCRVSFQKTMGTFMEKFGQKAPALPTQPFLFGNVVAMPLHNTGFGPAALDLIRRYIKTDLLITLCAHPFQALDSTRQENSEHVDRMDDLLSEFQSEREDGLLEFCTMADAERKFRASGALKVKDVQGDLRLSPVHCEIPRTGSRKVDGIR